MQDQQYAEERSAKPHLQNEPPGQRLTMIRAAHSPGTTRVPLEVDTMTLGDTYPSGLSHGQTGLLAIEAKGKPGAPSI